MHINRDRECYNTVFDAWGDAVDEFALVLVVMNGVEAMREGGVDKLRRAGLLLFLRGGRRQRRSEVGNERRHC